MVKQETKETWKNGIIMNCVFKRTYDNFIKDVYCTADKPFLRLCTLKKPEAVYECRLYKQ